MSNFAPEAVMKAFYRFQVLRKRSLFWKVVTWIAIFFLFVIVGLYKFFVISNHPLAITKTFIYIEPMSSYFRRSASGDKKDWNDYELLNRDRLRVGYGEQGIRTYIEGLEDDEEQRLIDLNGHNVLVSDKIALSRSLPDFRSDE